MKLNNGLFHIFFLTLMICMLGSFALQAQSLPPAKAGDVTDAQVIEEMKAYLTDLNDGTVSQKKLDSQLKFLKKILPIWKMPEFRKIRSLSLEDVWIQEQDNPYFYIGIAFHNKDKSDLLTKSDDKIKQIITFQDQLKNQDPTGFALLTSYKGFPADQPIKKIKFGPSNSKLVIMTDDFLTYRDFESRFPDITIRSRVFRGDFGSEPDMGTMGPGYPNPPKNETARFSSFALSEDERWLAMGSNDGKVLVAPISTNHIQYRYSWDFPGELITAIAFAPSQEFLAIGTERGQVAVYPLERNMIFGGFLDDSFVMNNEGDEDDTFKWHPTIEGLAFTSNSEYLAATNGSNVKVYSIKRKKMVPPIEFKNYVNKKPITTAHLFTTFWTDYQKLCTSEMSRTGILFPYSNLDFDPKSSLMVYKTRNKIYTSLVIQKENNPDSVMEIYNTPCQMNQVEFSPNGSLIAIVEKCSDEISSQESVHVFQAIRDLDWSLIGLIDPDKVDPYGTSSAEGDEK